MIRHISDGHDEISIQRLEKTVIISINGSEITLALETANELAEFLHDGVCVPVLGTEFFYHD